MTKKKALLAVLLLAVMTFGCALFAACGGGGSKFNVNWTVDEHVTVAVEDYKTPPEEVKEGTVLTFTVTPDDGYEVASVTGARKSGQKYTVTVNKDVEIKITAKKTLKELTVTGFDDTKQYVSGDEVVLEDVVVTATYFDGDVVVPLKNGTADGYTVSVPVGGEETITFSYGGKNVEFTVPTIRYKVTLDLGKDTVLSSSLQTAYAAIEDYHKDDKTGVITFSYLNLEDGVEIAMPTVGDMTRPNRNFLDWHTEKGVKLPAKIDKDSAEDVVFKAVWELQVATISKVELKIETVTVEAPEENEGVEAQAETTKQVPYLIIEGTFTGAATSARLQLKEGNKNISMYGPVVEKPQDSNDFLLKFDLTELLNQKDENSEIIDFEGAWCDIRLNATVDGEEESQQIHITEGQTFVDVEQMIKLDKRAYVFATYRPEGSNDTTLKVYYSIMLIEYTPSFSVKTVGEGENAKQVPTLTLTGTVNREEYFGKTLAIDTWCGSGSISAVKTAIGETGAFTIDIDLSQSGKASDAYFHFKILDGDTVKYPTSGEADIPISSATIEFPVTPDNPLTKSVKYMDDEHIAYYLGAKWGGLMLYVRDESAPKLIVTNAKLETVTVALGTQEEPQQTEVAVLVISGTWTTFEGVTLTKEEAAANFLKSSQHALQTGYHFNGANSWAYLDGAADNKAKNTIVEFNEDGTFIVKLLFTGDELVANRVYYAHFVGGNLSAANLTINTDSVTVGGLTYSFIDTSSMDKLAEAGMTDSSQSWYRGLLMVSATATSAPEATLAE